jgi:hypothetical protein
MEQNADNIEITSENCQACGHEHFNTDLHTVELSGYKRAVRVCEECLKRTAEADFRDAAEIVKDIAKIADSKHADPEERLNRIRELLGK